MMTFNVALLLSRLCRREMVQNSIINLFSRSVVMLITLGFIAYISRSLDRTQLGIFALQSVFDGILITLTSLGMATSALRKIPELIAGGEGEKTADIIKMTLLLPIVVSLLIILIAVSARGALSLLFLKTTLYEVIIPLIVLNSLLNTTFDKLILINFSLQKFRMAALLNISYTAVQRIAAIVLLVLWHNNIEAVLYGFTFGGIVVLCLGMLSIKKYLFQKYNGYGVDKFVRYSLPYYGQGWARFVFTQGDQTIVSLLFTPEILAIYFIAKKITSLVVTVIDALLEPVTPRLAGMRQQGLQQFKTVYGKVHHAFSYLLIAIVLIISVNNKFLIMLVGGPQYIAGFTLVSILGVSIFFYGLLSLNILGVYLNELPGELLSLNLIVAGVNTAAGIIFGYFGGITGFAYGQSIGLLVGIVMTTMRYRSTWLPPLIKDVVIKAIVMLVLFGACYMLNVRLSNLNGNGSYSQLIVMNILFIAVLGLFIYGREKKELQALLRNDML